MRFEGGGDPALFVVQRRPQLTFRAFAVSPFEARTKRRLLKKLKAGPFSAGKNQGRVTEGLRRAILR
jgi:hypothetical protein